MFTTNIYYKFSSQFAFFIENIKTFIIFEIKKYLMFDDKILMSR